MSQRRIKSQKMPAKSSSTPVSDLTQNEPSQNEKLTQLHSSKEFRDNVNKTVFYILAVHGCKDVFKRTEIVSEAIDKDHSRHFKKIIVAVNKKLKRMIGLKLVPCDDKNNSNLILINCLQKRPEILLNVDPKNKTKNLFLMLVLAVIMMNNDSVTEVELLRLLELLGFPVICDDNDLGKMTDVLKSFVEKQFVMYAPVDNADGGQDDADVQYEYKWGIRAHHQVAKDKVLEFVSKVYDREPSDFVEQHMKIEEEQLNNTDSEPSSEDSSEED